MRSRALSPSVTTLLALACATLTELPLPTLPAQGVVNQTLLRAPAADPATVARLVSGTELAIAGARSAIVYVEVEVDGPRGKFPIVRSSTGIVVDASGLVLTFRHLVQEAIGATDKRLFVQWDDAERTRLPATVAHSDEATGLVLLQVKPPAGSTAVSLGADHAVPGQPLVLLAYPEGKDLFAFAGVASPALADVEVLGRRWEAARVFLTDTKQDVRADGAAVLDLSGRLLGLFAAEKVRRDQSEPTLEELRQPSFGVVVPVAAIRQAFASVLPRDAAPSTAAPAAPEVQAVRRVAAAVVGVWGGEGEWPRIPTTDPGAIQRRPGLGSGVVLAAEGLVVTNAHLCLAANVRIRFADGEIRAAKVVRKHSASNLALLQVELPADKRLVAAETAPDDDVLLGETVLAIGNPAGGPVVVTAGVISAQRGREGGRIQADPNLGNQNAGGAIVDLAGRLVGIVDGGAIDPLEVAFAQRGDRATTETNLSTYLGIARVRSIFAAEIAALPATAAIRAPAAATAFEQALRRSPLVEMVARTSGAMLNVYVARDTRKPDPDDPFAEMEPAQLVTLGVGSGVLIDPTGIALSNWHVVAEAVHPDGSAKPNHAVRASVFGGKTYNVRVLSISREDDLSLLQLELAEGETVQAIELGSSSDLALGAAVAAIGNPHNRANTITFGVVTAKNQELRIKGRWAKMEHLLETDAAINGGNSGGALLDMAGRLVGINSAGGGTFTNRGFAIEVDHVRNQVLGLLLQAYKLRSPDLGLRVIDDNGEVVVMDVDARGPAAAAGLRSGDRIESLGGVPITWSPGFALQLARAEAGKPLPMVVRRQGARREFAPVPMASTEWAVVRQSGLQCQNLPFRANPERVRAAVVALHRRLTGDANAEPPVLPEQVVEITRVFAEEQRTPVDIQAGDLLLALELRHVQTGEPVFVRLEELGRLRDLWNDRELGTYEGSEWKVWLARGGEIRTAELVVKRLFW